MAKPLIGITTSLFLTEGGIMNGTKRQFVSDAYIQAVLCAGGVPVLLPIIAEQAAIVEQIAAVDGLLLSGGGDIQPQIFGEEPMRGLGTVLPERDTHELELVKLALASGKPVLGICRGCQLLNVALGGSIDQHLTEATVQHDQQSPGDYAGHTVILEHDSRLAGIWGDTVMTNSFHHQAIKAVAPGLWITARAKDGVIEAVEHETAPFAVGVQWHPELMIYKNPAMLALFTAFVNTANRK
ncbi:Putative glutamine amidotransferase [Sporomusa silvacetica DSM 10669]|uniref:Glutamine amidotransferase n=1 Tax=Sporomusa silvacetica DSM 10669 TaxID=1123289 RepID=A0ABZ3IQT9_9FIRM|nr:gamma-glutamyl-gamma-aminobutyrate hydrolase family protein [Sporomusa silvacetica]OZC20416.1 putative glutamine amidotransferasec [Sporomusa silvacetica DSM 10669]